MKLPVVVRRMRGTGELIALFVTRPATSDPALCWAYSKGESLTAADPNKVMRATDKVETRDAQGFVVRSMSVELYREMGIEGPAYHFEIQQRDRREENLEARRNQIKEQGND
jgi:hypothetical protein